MRVSTTRDVLSELAGGLLVNIRRETVNPVVNRVWLIKSPPASADSG